jgi:hypothetical protein
LALDKSFIALNKSFVTLDKSFVALDKSFVALDKSFVKGKKSFVKGKKSFVKGKKSLVKGKKSLVEGKKSLVGGKKSFCKGRNGFSICPLAFCGQKPQAAGQPYTTMSARRTGHRAFGTNVRLVCLSLTASRPGELVAHSDQHALKHVDKPLLSGLEQRSIYRAQWAL